MRSLGARVLATTAGLAAGLGLLIAGPAGPARAEESAQELVERLQREGYTVTIDKLGTAPISDCVVTSVRNPQRNTELRPLLGTGPGEGSVLIEVVANQTISVSLDCSR